MSSTSVVHGLDEFVVQYPRGHTPETVQLHFVNNLTIKKIRHRLFLHHTQTFEPET